MDLVRNQEKKVIKTVTGEITAGQLGYCHCHEHLFIAMGRSYQINPWLYMDDLNSTVNELRMYKSIGGSSIVDAQPIGCGRMAGYLTEASKQSNVNIIASTGFHKLIFYNSDHWIFEKDEDYLSELFIGEIESGMFIDGDNGYPVDKIGAKAGIIKTAVDTSGIEGSYIKLFNAAAAASIATGAPIICHIEMGSDALKVIDFLIQRKVEPSHIILCHLDRARYDTGYHMEVASTGVFLEYDTIGRFKYHSDEKEIELIESMVEGGYEDSILLGLDTTRQRLKSYGGDIGLDYIKNSFTNKLYSTDIDKDIIDKFTVENPVKALTIK